MTTNSTTVTRKVRTEYMKKFRDPKWESFTKCYQDSLKYRISRRAMEQKHRPLFQDGWDSGSDTSCGSSPAHKDPAGTESSGSDPPPHSSGSRYESTEGPRQVNGDAGDGSVETGSIPVANGYQHHSENGPVAPRLKRRPRAPRSEPVVLRHNLTSDDSTDAVRNPGRAKSQPPVSTKPRGQDPTRLDWAIRSLEVRERRKPNMRGSVSAGEIHRADVGVQTRRESDKRGQAPDRRRARSADLDKLRRGTELMPVKDCWITEYMRCFSARLR